MSLIKPLTENVLRDIVETNRSDSAIAKALKPFFTSRLKKRWKLLLCRP